MGHGPALSALHKDLIFKCATSSPSRDRKDVAKEIKGELEKKRLRVPPLSTLLRMISEARASAVDYLDKPWSIACQHDPATAVSPEVLPLLVHIFFQRILDGKRQISIRQALWCARLHALVSHLCRTDPEESYGEFARRCAFNIISTAESYAVREKVCQAEQRPLDTADLDEELFFNLHWRIAKDLEIAPEKLLTAMQAAGMQKPAYGW